MTPRRLVVCLFALAACSGTPGAGDTDAGPDAPDARPPDPNAQWELVTAPSTEPVTGVYVESGGQAWVAFGTGLRHYAGGGWQDPVAAPADAARPIYDVYVAGGQVFANSTPQLLRWDGDAWSQVGELDNCAWDHVRITSAGDAVFAGCPYYAGFARWGDQAFGLAKEQIIIYDIVAVAPDDVIAAGAVGIYRYTGFELGTDTIDDWQLLHEPDGLWGFPALWADAAGRIVMGIDDGVILHGDHTALAPVATPAAANVAALFGTRYDDLFAAGEGGAIWHFDGAAWSAMDSGVQVDLLDVHGTPDGLEVWAVGADGTVLRLER